MKMTLCTEYISYEWFRTKTRFDAEVKGDSAELFISKSKSILIPLNSAGQASGPYGRSWSRIV